MGSFIACWLPFFILNSIGPILDLICSFWQLVFPIMYSVQLLYSDIHCSFTIPGLIMGSFIACWLPFFILYSIGPMLDLICSFWQLVFPILYSVQLLYSDIHCSFIIPGLIMGSFIACWLPCFIVYSIGPILVLHAAFDNWSSVYSFWIQTIIVILFFLGLIMGSFIACWLPFFILYSIGPICPVCHPKIEPRYNICLPIILFFLPLEFFPSF
jgi:hypothetical protein